MSGEFPQRQVGDVIRYSSGGTVHTGRIIEVLDHGHVKVDNSPIVIPPTWILEDYEE